MLNTLSMKRVSRVLVLLLMLTFLLGANSRVFAGGLNGVETNQGTVEQQQQQQQQPVQDKEAVDKENAAKAIGDLFSEAGVKEESLKEAQVFIQPFAKLLNYAMAVILGLTSLLMMFTTILDLLYMAFPPIRDMLDGGMNGAQQGAGGGRGSRGMSRGMRGMGGMGMGGMSGGMGGMGMGGMSGGMGGMGMGGYGGGMGAGMGGMQQQSPQSIGGGLSALGRFVSDEAIAACIETGGGPMAAMQGGGGPAPFKSILISYAKKRALFLSAFGVCAVLFSSTIFTDIGIKIGTWLLRILSGLGN